MLVEDDLDIRAMITALLESKVAGSRLSEWTEAPKRFMTE